MSSALYLTVKQIVEGEEYPFSNGQMRQFLDKRHKNGLQKAVRKIGKCIYINKVLFNDWIEVYSSETLSATE